MSGMSHALRLQDPVQGVQLRSAREVAANPVHLMYVLEQQIEREQFPPEIEQKYLALHQGAAGAALRRVHRQGDPDRLPGELLASTARTSSTATSPTPTTGSRTTSTATPTPARSFDRAALNAELEKIEKPAGISQPEGLPQRDRQLRAARARQQRTARTRPGPATRSCAR
ncbi:MAG: hypothetical protein MZW92_20020 [Comamonadaceae bacterium]|nr:hypothetical protein [Comamonadaceae bacterium]